MTDKATTMRMLAYLYNGEYDDNPSEPIAYDVDSIFPTKKKNKKTSTTYNEEENAQQKNKK